MQATVSQALRAQVDAQVSDFNFALERKYAYPSALAVLDTVAKLLPDDTWLTQFELKSTAKGKEVQREIMLRGESANAAKLVPLFEESQLFADAAQRGPTTKIQPGPGEIFDLGAQLRRRAAPAVATAVVASPAPAAGDAPAAPTRVPASDTPAAPPAAGMTPPAPANGAPREARP